MASNDFDSLLQQAELLNTGLDSEAELPRVQRNFKQLLTAGDRLCSSIPLSQDNAQIKAALLLSSKGQEAPAVSDRIKSLSAAPDSANTLVGVKCDTDIKGFLQNERENGILALLEEQKQGSFREAEDKHWKSRIVDWDNEKQQMLSKLLGCGDGALNFTAEVLEQSSATLLHTGAARVNPKSLMDCWDLTYSKQMHAYNDLIINGCVSPDLVSLLLQGAEKLNQANIVTMWKMVKYMTSVSCVDPSMKIEKARTSSPKFVESLVKQAKAFLEENFLGYMKSCVYSNPHTAQLGGELGTVNLVKSFLKIHPASLMQDYDDGELEGVPLWAVIFYCLRCGDIEAACSVVEQFEHVIPEFNIWIQEYQQDGKLSSSTESKLRVYYKKQVHVSNDPYKIAVYSIIGRCDICEVHADVANKTEDYLWMKLSQIVIEENASSTPQDSLSLIRLQKMLSEEYGESHFGASSNPLLYFKVLFLTCQFEAAIEFLSRSDSLRAHATHVAIAIHTNHLLLTPPSLHSKLLIHEPSNNQSITKVDRLNLPQLVMLYTRKFELTDPREALNYYFVLRQIPCDEDTLFHFCTSELVRESGEYEMLLGKLNKDGTRKPGAIDKYCGGDSKKLISKIAADTEAKGLYEEAVMLNDLCGDHDKTVLLLNRLLSPVVKYSSNKDHNRQRLTNLATNIAERYRDQAVSLTRDLGSTFHLLLDLCYFFDLYHSDKNEQALSVIGDLHILPANTDQVPNKVAEFKLQDDEIRQNISDILIATMTLLVKQCNQQRNLNKSLLNNTSDIICSNARSYGRALITFAGMLPYHLPVGTTSRLVQLEVQMN